jgi:pimeloyl-ACP methyl ester carboxylesterase
LAKDFRVVALSLPGFGESDAPDSGNVLNTAADAVMLALDSLSIGRASFAGHSFAGWILSRIATRHRTRVTRMIYLDAAFDLGRSDSIVALRPLPRPALVDVKTQGDVIRWLRNNFFGMWSPALEAEYRGRSVEEAQRAPLLKPIVADARAAPEEGACFEYLSWVFVRSPPFPQSFRGCLLATFTTQRHARTWMAFGVPSSTPSALDSNKRSRALRFSSFQGIITYLSRTAMRSLLLCGRFCWASVESSK